MNITFLTINLAKGGAENQLIKLVINLKTKGYAVNIITLGKDNDFELLLNENKINVEFIPFKFGLGLFKIFKHVVTLKTDVLISFMFPSNIIARLVRVFYKVKLITSVRASNISFFYSFIYKFTYRLDDVTTFNSETAMQNLINMKIASPSKSFVINNAISIPQINVSSNNDSNIFTISSIAHFRDNEKDYKTLFKALKIVKLKGYNFKVFIIGRLFNKSWPIKMIKDFELSNNIKLLGFVNNPELYLKKSNALVLSTFGESTPNSLLEAMSYSLPVIASNVQGCDKVLINSNAGFLSKPKDPNDLALKIIKLINLTDLEREKLGTNGLNFVKYNFSENSVYNQWEKIINK